MAEKGQIYVEKSVLETLKPETVDITGDKKKGFGKKAPVGDRTKGLMDVWKIVLGDSKGENENMANNDEQGGEIGEFSKSYRKKGGYKKGEKSRFRGSESSNKGKMSNKVDSGLVWVRKEEKSDDVCVAGNCCEGVLAKAGENEKKPCRGRP